MIHLEGRKRTFLYCVTWVVVHMDLFAQYNVGAIGMVIFLFSAHVVTAEWDNSLGLDPCKMEHVRWS